jgi:hypothetical protein
MKLEIAAVLFIAGLAGAQPFAGYVLDQEGVWTLPKNSQPLSRGQRLPAGSLLSNSQPSDFDYIVVANLKGDTIKTIRCKSKVCRECSTAGACLDPIRPLPAIAQLPGAMEVAFDAVMGLLAGRGERYSAHRVRGSSIEEAVLRCENGGLDAHAALRNVSKGHYEVLFRPLTGDTGSAGPITTSIDWDPAGMNKIVCPGSGRGLWELSFASGSENAWILLAGPADYPRLAASFESALAKVKAWGASVSAESSRGYLRATLEYLATPGDSSR